jgi:hypothetical protein
VKPDPNPDVEEVLARNRETCAHPRDSRKQRTIAVGSGIPGVMGCHMETEWYCTGCDRKMPLDLTDIIGEDAMADFQRALERARTGLDENPRKVGT